MKKSRMATLKLPKCVKFLMSANALFNLKKNILCSQVWVRGSRPSDMRDSSEVGDPREHHGVPEPLDGPKRIPFQPQAF